MLFFVNEEKRLIPIDVENEEEYKDKEGFILTDKLPEARFPFYKLDENGNIVPDEELILEKARELKIEEIKSAFDYFIKNGFTCSNGITMDADFIDIQKLKAGYELALDLGLKTIIVGDYYNKDHEVPIEEVKKMLVELGLNYSTLWNKKITLRKKAKKAVSLEELDAINWEGE